MKRELFSMAALTLLVAVTIWAATPIPDKGMKNPHHVIDLTTAAAHFQKGDALFLDARSMDDYADGHIPGAINIPVHDENRIELMVRLEDMLRSAPVLVVYCTGVGCDMSRLLADGLVSFGIPEKQIRLFEGGMEEWSKAGYPVSTDTEFQKSLLGSAD